MTDLDPSDLAIQQLGLPTYTQLHCRVSELEAVLGEVRLQIEYMQEKFQPTGSGNAVLARINAALAGKP